MRLFVSALVLFIFQISAYAIVDMKNANYSNTWTDMEVPGSGYDLRIQRTYNSRSLFNGIFGFGWCSDFETRLEVTAEGNLKTIECGGGLEVYYTPKNFSPNSVNKTIDTIVAEVKKRNKDLGSKYLANLKTELKDNKFLREEFVRQMKLQGKVKSKTVFYANGREVETIVFSGKEYKRTLPDGTYQKFNSNGHMTVMYDKNGNFLKLTWQGDLLNSVVDNNGRKLNFKYFPRIKKVKQIIGPNGLKAEYKFAGENLVFMKNAWGNPFKYDYDDNHNLTRVDFPDKTYKALTYNKDKDWVTSFRNRKGCKETYTYEVDKEDPKNHYWSKVVKKCGNKVTNRSTYEFFHRYRKDGNGKYLYRVVSDENGNITDIVYHEVFGKPISIRRNTSRVAYIYFNNGRVKSKIEQLRRIDFSYKNKCNKVSGVKITYYAPVQKPKRRTAAKSKSKKVKKKKIKVVNTKFRYDNRKCNLKYAENSDGQKAKIQYDNRGRISRIEDQSKKKVFIKYEEQFGKPSIVTRPGLGTITVTYKSDGEIEKVNSKQGPTVAVQVASIFNNLLDIIAPATSEANL